MFIALAGALALMTAFALALPFLRKRDETTSRAAYDAQTYRAQLAEIDQDVSRGVLTDTEAKAAKIEISRRLLTATDAMEAEEAAPDTSDALRKRIGIGAGIGIPLAATMLYLAIGEAGRPDMPLASRTDFEAQMAQRPSQSNAEAILERGGFAPQPQPADTPEAKQVLEMVEQVKVALEQDPNDAQGRLVLARTQARMGRYADAWRNYALLAEQAKQPDVEIYGELMETMVSATNGYISPEAETVANKGAELDPADPRFRHYKALALAQRNERAEALLRWTALLQDAEPGARWVPMVYGHAAEMAASLGVPPPPNPAATSAPGPSQSDIAAAVDMPETERNAMIEGMVAGLAERLAEDPEDLQGWLRLIRAYTVMGRIDQRDTAIEMARKTFTGDAKALERIDAAKE